MSTKPPHGVHAAGVEVLRSSVDPVSCRPVDYRSAERSTSALRRPLSDRLAKLERSTSRAMPALGWIATCPQFSQTSRLNPFVVTSRVDACRHFLLRRDRLKPIPFRHPTRRKRTSRLRKRPWSGYGYEMWTSQDVSVLPRPQLTPRSASSLTQAGSARGSPPELTRGSAGAAPAW
jgi:hypothetical protein